MNNELLSALWERQRREGWSDRRLASEIGVSNSTLSLIRAGQRGLGLKVISQIIRAFPEYTHLAVFYLQQSANVTSISVDKKEPSNAG